MFDLLVSTIGKVLKLHGFSKNGKTFYLLKHGNYGMINFQKSQNSTKDVTVFTINVGVTSSVLKKIHYPYGLDKKPNIGECHWQQRIGFLMPIAMDYWWKIDNSESIDNLAVEIINILRDSALPEIEKRMSDESLMNEWLGGTYTGITEYQRYVFLTTLLKLKKDERLPAIVDEFLALFKGQSIEHSVKDHVKELETYM